MSVVMVEIDPVEQFVYLDAALRLADQCRSQGNLSLALECLQRGQVRVNQIVATCDPRAASLAIWYGKEYAARAAINSPWRLQSLGPWR